MWSVALSTEATLVHGPIRLLSDCCGQTRFVVRLGLLGRASVCGIGKVSSKAADKSVRPTRANPIQSQGAGQRSRIGLMNDDKTDVLCPHCNQTFSTFLDQLAAQNLKAVCPS